MVSELCSKCRQLRNAKVTVSSRKMTTPDGKTKEIKTRSFHCEACGAFIRSEDTEVPTTNG